MIHNQANIYSIKSYPGQIKKEVSKLKKSNKDFNPTHICSMDQTHSTKVQQIKNLSEDKTYKNTDGLITNRKDICLVIKTADCIPLVISDKNKTFILAAHLGWRGIYNGFLKKIFKNIQNYTDKFDQVSAYIGPSIRKCCYSFIQKPIQADKTDWKKYIEKNENKYHINLQSFLINKLKKSGIKSQNIFDAKTCTHHNDLPSYKRDKNKSTPSASLLTIVQLRK